MYASRDAKEEIPMYRKLDLAAIIYFGVTLKKCKKMVISPHKEQHRGYVTPLCGVTYPLPFFAFDPFESVTFIKLACAILEQNYPLETPYVFLSNFSSRYLCCRIYHLPAPVFETAKVNN